MALKATVFKAELQVADMDRGCYETFALTLARHPSETDQRLMIRLLAFALHAHEQLVFTRGLCVDDEPSLWRKSLSDEIELWIDLGMPDEKRLKKACSRARSVVLYAYGDRAVPIWWQQLQGKLGRLDNLTIFQVEDSQAQALAAMAARNMQLSATIQDGEVWLSDQTTSVQVAPRELHFG